jgi:hypothetical protein
VLIFSLLRKGDGLRLFVTDADREARPGGGDGQVSVAEATDEIEGFAGGLLVREAQSVVGDAALDGLAHLGRRAEEAVGRHEPLERLVGSSEVVRLHEEVDSARAVREVGEHGAGEELVPERLPEALDLAERLRVLRPTLDVLDAVPPELLFELGLAPPRGVLTALIGQDLARCTEVGDAPRQRLHDERRALMVGERVRHEVTGVVVHEADQVQPLVLAQQEGEEVRLPELVRLGALEASRRVLARPRGRRGVHDQTLLMEDAAHLRLGDAKRLEPRQHVADAARTVIRVLLPHRRHSRAGGVGFRLPSPRERVPRFRGESLDAARLVALDPVVDGRGGDPEGARDLQRRRPSLEHLLHGPETD